MPIEDIDSEVVDFVEKNMDNFTTWEVLSFFHDNPEAGLTESRVAMSVGRHQDEVAGVIQSLVSKGTLAKEDDPGGLPTYRYAAKTSFRKEMDSFMAVAQDRTKRLSLVDLVLQKESRGA